MLLFFNLLFDTSSFVPRWQCGQWSSFLGWLHILSDISISLVYFAIPMRLAFLVLKRKDLPFPRILWLFVIFIASCGCTHLLEALIFWVPLYTLAGFVKGFTAIASAIAAISLFWVIPRLLALPAIMQVNLKLKQALSHLERSNQDLEDFAHIASHDLKGPLFGINIHANFLLEDCQTLLQAKDTKKLEEIIQLTMSMEGFINTLLHYSRLGLKELPKEEIALNPLLNKVVSAINATFNPQNVIYHIHSDLPQIQGNFDALEEMLYHLIANALQYNDKEEKIIEVGSLTSFQSPQLFAKIEHLENPILLFVKDNGSGIPSSQLQSVFETFKRAENAAAFASGMGLGLAMVKKIVEKLEGEIWIESQEGTGTIVYFTLPSAKPSLAIVN